MHTLKGAEYLLANHSDKNSKKTHQKSVSIKDDEDCEININMKQEASIVYESEEEDKSFSKDTH